MMQSVLNMMWMSSCLWWQLVTRRNFAGSFHVSAYLDTLGVEEAAEVIDTYNIAKDVTKKLHEVKGKNKRRAAACTHFLSGTDAGLHFNKFRQYKQQLRSHPKATANEV